MANPHFFLILISISLVMKPPPQVSAAAVALFIFGDSLFDAGNNNYINTTTLDQANFWPYGESYFSHPTGRFSDGRLISDFIGKLAGPSIHAAQDNIETNVDVKGMIVILMGVLCEVIAEHAKLPLIPPYLEPRNYHVQNYHGVNFASAGAGALSQTFQGLVISLKTQLKYYVREVAEIRKNLGEAEAGKISSSGVYLFSIGTNDYMSPFILNSTIFTSFPHSKYVRMVLRNISTVLKAIHRRGGRKFVFLNLGEIGCLPGLRILKPEIDGGGCLEEASNLAKLHNKALNTLLTNLEKQLHGFKYFVYDFNTSLAQRITQPLKYGLKEGKAACCGTGRLNGVFSCGGKRLVKEFQVCQNPNQYVFWDSYHPTQTLNKQMAHHMWNIGLTKLFLC